MATESLIWTATIRRPFGVHGEVRIHTHNAEFRHLEKLKTVTLRASDGTLLSVEVSGFRVVGGEPVMRFVGYESPEVARTLNGMHLLVKRSEATPLQEGEFYTADLIGCTLYTQEQELATVEATVDGAQAILLEVQLLDSSGTRMVPFLGEYIGEVDIALKRIELLTPWILA